MAGVGWFESQAPNQHGLYAQNLLEPELVGRGLGCQPRASTPAHSHTLALLCCNLRPGCQQKPLGLSTKWVLEGQDQEILTRTPGESGVGGKKVLKKEFSVQLVS